MSRIEKIEAELAKLSTEELRQIRDWLDELIEYTHQFTDEFEAAIQQSEREMNEGLRPRLRHPNS